MATLAFSVEADWQKVVKLRDEIQRLESELYKLSRSNASADTIDKLEQELSSCRREMMRAVSAAEDLGNKIGKDVAEKLKTASDDTLAYGEATKSSVQALMDADFNTPMEKVSALSYELYNSQQALANSVKTLQQYRDSAKEAFESGDDIELQKFTDLIGEESARVMELRERTLEYKGALDSVLSAMDMGGNGFNAPQLFNSEEEIAHVEELREKIISLREQIFTMGQGGDTRKLTAQLVEMEDELRTCETNATLAAGALGDGFGAKVANAQQSLYLLNKELTEQQTTMYNLQSEVENARARYEELQESSTATSEEVERAGAKYLALADSLKEAQGRMVALQNAQQSAQQTWDTLQEIINPTEQPAPTLRLYDNEEDIKAVEEMQTKMQNLRDAIAVVGASGGDTTELSNQLADLSDELFEAQMKASNTAKALGDDLGRRASEAQQRLYELNDAVREQQAEVDKWQTEVDNAYDKLEELRNSETATSEEVRNAAQAYDQLGESLLQARERMNELEMQQESARAEWKNISDEISNHDSTLMKMLGGYDNYKNMLNMLPAPLQATVKGIQSTTKAAWEFIKTPVGAVIGAITLALTALYKWFNQSAEGQRAFAKISGYVTGVLGQLNEIVLKVGKALYTAFTDPQKAVKDFWNTVKSYLLDKVDEIGDIFGALGKVIHAVFTPSEWDEMDDRMDALKATTKKFTDGMKSDFDSAGNAVKNYVKGIGDAAKEQARINSERMKLEDEESAFGVRREELNGAMTEARQRITRSDLSAEERRQAIEDYKKYNQELTDVDVDFAKRRRDLIEQENALTTNPREREMMLNDANAAVFAAENAGKQRLNMLTRTEASLNKQDKKGTEQAIKEAEKRQQALTKLEQEMMQIRDANEKARIALMQDGSEKALAQIQQEYDAQMTAINKQENELRALNKKGGVETQENGLTAEQNEQMDKARENADNARIKAEQAVYDAERDAMLSFLKEYGTFQQRKLAITEQYAKKIADASNVYEQMSLTNQRDAELQALDLKFSDKTDWGAIFSCIDQYSTDYLKRLEGQLETMLKGDDVTAEQAKVIGDRIAQIEKTLIDRATSWRDLLGLGNEKLRETAKLQADLNNLYDQRNRAEEAQNKLLEDMNTLRQAIVDYAEAEVGVKLVVDDVDLATADDVLQQMQDAGATDGQTGDVSNMFTQWASLQNQSQQLGNTIQGLNTDIEGAEDALGGMSEGAGGFGASIALIDKIIHKVNESIQSMVELLDQIGLGDTKFADGFKDFAESSEYATKGWESLKSGDPIGVASGVVGSLTSLGNALGKWTGSSLFGESDVDLHKDIERLTLSNNDLANAIDGLTDKMSDSTTSFADAMAEYEQAMADIEEMEANTMEMMQRSGAAYSNGFLGLGGHHSSNTKINDAMSASEWARISEVAGTSVTSAKDFWNLTSEQMYAVSVHATDLYTKIKDLADDGYEDAAQYMDDYIGYWKEAEELLTAYNEKITNISFDSLTSNFKNAISDMTKTASDFADDFEDMMKEAVINFMMSDKYAQALQDWYNDFALAMENDGLDSTEQQDLKDSYMRIVNDARDELEGLYDTLGWSRTSYSQQGTSGGWETMSEDTGQELNGRFTALQETGLELLTQSKEQTEWARSLYDINTQIENTLVDSYLELQEINDNTRDTVTQLQTVVRYIKSVKENTDKL